MVNHLKGRAVKRHQLHHIFIFKVSMTVIAMSIEGHKATLKELLSVWLFSRGERTALCKLKAIIQHQKIALLDANIPAISDTEITSVH